jgi:predicted RNA binding protein YcfA (HicA-like mRNA interferase family)
LADLPSVKAKRLFRALQRCGFDVARTRGNHRFLKHSDGRTMVFAFHDRETIGPRMLARILRDARIPLGEIRTHL